MKVRLAAREGAPEIAELLEALGYPKLHRDERVAALIEAQLYRVTDDGGLKLVAEVGRSHSAIGIGDVFEAFTDQLIVHQDEPGELP